MIKLKSLQKLLNTDEKELKKLDVEKLRTLLGVFRYTVRFLEREINQRCGEQPLGNVNEYAKK